MGQPVVGSATAAHHTINSGFWIAAGDSVPPSSVEVPSADLTPSLFSLRKLAPNPAQANVVIDYDVPSGGGSMTLRVYDVQGSAVRTLVEGGQVAGRKTTAWDGRDDQGRMLPSGLYFVRMDTPGHTFVRKTLLLR
jgi:flagellar hook assembly protein FlgD